MIKLSNFVMKYLENEGIKHIFLVPGGGCIHLVDSLGKSSIKYVCNLHEQGSGICAEAYSQYSNGLGVALVTTGPGGTNILTAIAGAWLDSTPMLILCGQVNRKDITWNGGPRQIGFQELSLVSLTQKITKYSATVSNPTMIKAHLETAIYKAKEGRPGPVVLEIPQDVQAQMIDEETLPSGPVLSSEDYSFNWKKTISKIIPALNNSKRPIILVGNGVRLSGGIKEFYKFISATNIPVLTTWKALDLLEETHPLFVGRPGAIAQRGANFNQQNSDFIICLGARLDQGQTAFHPEWFATKAQKVIVDVDMTEIEKLGISVEYPVPMDAKKFLIEMNNQIDSIKIDTKDWLKHCKETYERYPVVLDSYRENAEKVNLYAFIGTLSDILPENSLVVPGSSGACSEVTMQALKIKKGTRVFNTEGLGAMGFGIPASIGACIASGKNTICIDGDGGFFMNIQELEVVHRLNLPIKYFVLNNNGYGSIRATQNTHFGGHLVASNPTSGLTLPKISLTAMAYDIAYQSIKDNDSLMEGISNVLMIQGPVICEVFVDENHETLPKISVLKNAQGEFEAQRMENLKPFLSEDELKKEIL